LFRLLPTGDILEVGCLYGRSALVLGYLAHRHKIGNVICVDPWNVAVMTDQGTQAAVLNKDLDWINFEQIFRIFLSTAAILDNIGYIRQTSKAARPIYEAARQIGHLDSPELGCLPLSPQLSLLHIDGNHRYDHVRKDVDTWSPYLTPGGWLLLDDYVWAFGDGPKRVGDELLDSPCYDTAFVSGDTLFLRRNSTAPFLAS
jgi:SAM-dependent methyltransferase